MAKKKRSAPTKSCPHCGTSNHARKKLCDGCGNDTGSARQTNDSSDSTPAASNGESQFNVDYLKTAACLLRQCNSLQSAQDALQDAYDIING